jgi:hypothetical protein
MVHMNPTPTEDARVDLSAESVAGEEDPGACIDMVQASAMAGASKAPGSTGGSRPDVSPPPMSRGDEAPAGTPGTGEDVCRTCGGTGKLNGSICPDCDGTGKIVVGIGGA